MLRNRLKYVGVIGLIGAVALSGCSGKEESQITTQQPSTQEKGEVKVSTEPVSLVFYTKTAVTKEDFEKLLAEPVRKKYPHITLVQSTPTTGKLDSLIMAGQIPDIMYYDIRTNELLDLDYPLDLTEMAKKFNSDLTRFDPMIMQSIKQVAAKGELYALPYARNAYGLWYNKSLFDKFGIAYPKDGMTWDEAIELGKSMTRVDGPVQYRGLDAFQGSITNLGAPLAMSYIDPKTNKAIIPDKWKEIFELGMQVYNLSGNRPANIVTAGYSQLDPFFKQQNLAMVPFFVNGILGQLAEPSKNGFDWDVAQIPSLKELPGVSGQIDFHQLLISKHSKYKDQAFQVIDLLTSYDAQLIATKGGRLTALNNEQAKEQFASDLPFVKGKNLKSLFAGKYVPTIHQSRFNAFVEENMKQAFASVFNGKADINTALSKALEQSNMKIETELKK
jgi:multiple sugar transport system substrate-binding protein